MSPTNERNHTNTPCHHCGVIHGLLCPYVKAYEYHLNGTLKRVEFRDPQPGEASTVVDLFKPR